MLNNRWGRALARGPKGMEQLEAETLAEHKAAGVDNRVSVAFDKMAPLLVMNQPIQQWLRKNNLYDLTSALPDVASPQEAAKIGAMESRLTPQQESTLASLLSQELERRDAVDHDEQAAGYLLYVDRGHVIQGLRALRLPRKLKSGARAILGFDGSFLTLEVLDQMFAASATGTWPGNARVSATLIGALRQALPAGDPLVVQCDRERLSFGTLRVDCEWQPVSEELTTMPATEEWVATLALNYSMSRGKLITDGFKKSLDDAERKLTQRLRSAAKSLEPLGVTVEDLRRLVETRLRERYGRIPPEH